MNSKNSLNLQKFSHGKGVSLCFPLHCCSANNWSWFIVTSCRWRNFLHMSLYYYSKRWMHGGRGLFIHGSACCSFPTNITPTFVLFTNSRNVAISLIYIYLWRLKAEAIVTLKLSSFYLSSFTWFYSFNCFFMLLFFINMATFHFPQMHHCFCSICIIIFCIIIFFIGPVKCTNTRYAL